MPRRFDDRMRRAAALLALLAATPSATAPFHLAYDVEVVAGALGTPVVEGSRVFVTTEPRQRPRLDARDLATGRYLWSARTGGTHYDLKPLAGGGALLRMSDDDTLRRYSAAGGRVLWRRAVPALPEGPPHGQVLADGVWVYSEGQQLAVYDARTGSARWSTPLDCFTCEAAVGGGRVYAAGDGKVRAYDANDGRVVWTSRGVGGLDTISTVRLDGGTLYALASVGSPVSGYVVDAYRASDGTPLWHVSFGGGRGFDPLVRPAAAGGLFVYPAPDGYLYAVRDGHVAWKAGLGGAVDSTPAIGDGRVWIVDASGRLTAFSAADGRTLWAAPPVPGLSSSSPALGGGYVLVGTPSGHLIAYAPA